ncbi:hypothetical protein [Anabaena sp. FACHB-83]|uniref:hypothetical protein n=1 Tax=Anabaena sp. FACHB-83 TaxID=2692772 RepID=UPI00198ECF35|nr:hypothetical protein [Anabaena sp. FACHB-83]MBD2480272.1 hypothetical protein [Anabaena sp. FACHB-83]
MAGATLGLGSTTVGLTVWYSRFSRKEQQVADKLFYDIFKESVKLKWGFMLPDYVQTINMEEIKKELIEQGADGDEVDQMLTDSIEKVSEELN